MDRLQKRRTRQVQTTAERHYYKFIGNYVKSTHKDIFNEAHAMYNEAKQENPGVKDLTKTVFYMRRTCPNVPVPRYYNSRKLKSVTQKPKEQHTQMVLNIQLLGKQTTDSLLSATDTPLQTTPQPPEPETESIQPLLPEETYMSLLEDLQKDPDLERILNDFPFDANIDPLVDNNMAEGEQGMDTPVINDMVWPSQFTLLEAELEKTFNTM